MDHNLPVPLRPVNDGIFFGLDVVLQKSGVACIEVHPDGAVRLEYQTINTKKLRGGARLKALYVMLEKALSGWLMRDDDLEPRLAVIESGAYSASGRVFQLGGASAIAQLVMMDLDIPYIEATPQQIKQFTTRNLSASKKMVRSAVAEHWGLDKAKITEDEADAAAGAMLARATATRVVRNRVEAKLVHSLLTTYSPESL